MAHPVTMAPAEKTFGFIISAIIGLVVAYVLVRNAIAKRAWVAQSVVRLALGFILATLFCLLIIWLIVTLGFRGWWVQYAGIAIGGAFGLRLAPPLVLQEWSRLRSRKIPRHIQKKVIDRHIRLTGSYDPAREHIDHVYPFSKGGGHTLDNLHVIPKEENQRKRDQTPSGQEWARADIARARAFVLKFRRRR